MILSRPTVEQERWLELAHRHPALRVAAEVRAGGWKTPSMPSRVLMFVLGLVAASMVGGTLSLFPAPMLFAGIALVAAAEWLIRDRGLVAGGIEEALMACGIGALTAQGLLWTKPMDDAVIALAISAALLAAGLRVRNALFTTLAALGASLAIGFAGAGTLLGGRPHDRLALLWCAGVAVAAIALGARHWRRPSHDRMLDGLVILMPLGAFGWALAASPAALTPARLASAGLSAALPAVIALSFAIAWLVIGARRRSHAPLIGALLSAACLAWSLRELTGLPLYGRLILWGTIAFVAGLALERWLRVPRAGITSSPLAPRSNAEDLLQVAGAAQLSPARPAPPEPFDGGGGNFGGGGASGRF